ncbi:hypothetical protein F5Y09DRAFT_87819 [Xylaria sp. FL1042]|nr:hypothetical protein F5Y09DRAFT_87819 [Xylaria sp. FL1042]
MATQTTQTTQLQSWKHQYAQPYRKRKNVECHDGHIHRNNSPVVVLVLVRLNASSKMELLLDRNNVSFGDTKSFACIGGRASSRGELALTTAYREAKEHYIGSDDIEPFSLEYTRDHGGYKYLRYTYVFAEYNPKNVQPPSSASRRAKWFALDALPNNLIKFMQEDLPALRQILSTQVMSIIQERRTMRLAQAAQNPFNQIDADGDCAMSDAPPEQNVGNGANYPAQVQYPELPCINRPNNYPFSPSRGLNWNVNTWSLNGIPNTFVSSADEGDVDSDSATLSTGRSPRTQAPNSYESKTMRRPKFGRFFGESYYRAARKSRFRPAGYEETEDEETDEETCEETAEEATKKGRFYSFFKNPFASSSQPDAEPAVDQELDQGNAQQEDQGNVQREDQDMMQEEDQGEGPQQADQCEMQQIDEAETQQKDRGGKTGIFSYIPFFGSRAAKPAEDAPSQLSSPEPEPEPEPEPDNATAAPEAPITIPTASLPTPTSTPIVSPALSIRATTPETSHIPPSDEYEGPEWAPAPSKLDSLEIGLGPNKGVPFFS